MSTDERNRIPKEVATSMIKMALVFDTLKIVFGIFIMLAGFVMTVIGQGASLILAVLIPFVGGVLGTAVNMVLGLTVVGIGMFLSFILSLMSFLTFLRWYSSRDVTFFERGVGTRLAAQAIGIFVPFVTTFTVFFTIRTVQEADREYNVAMRKKKEEEQKALAMRRSRQMRV